MKKNIAMKLRQLVEDQYFHVLESIRYRFNKLIESATESDIREAFMDKPDFIYNEILLYKVLSKEFRREVESNLKKVQGLEKYDD